MTNPIPAIVFNPSTVKIYGRHPPTNPMPQSDGGEEMTSEDPGVGERFEQARDHLDRADDILDGLTDEIAQAAGEALEEEDGDEVYVVYDEETGTFDVQLPILDIADRLSERLGEPFHVSKGGRGDITVRHEDDDMGGGQRDRVKGIKSIVREKQQNQDRPGARTEEVIRDAVSQGFTRKQVEHEIQKLRDKGEIYSPDQDHLRLV